jgi:hypothetical protein
VGWGVLSTDFLVSVFSAVDVSAAAAAIIATQNDHKKLLQILKNKV